jgi:hypothetical protein
MNTRKPGHYRKPFVFRLSKEKLEECREMSPAARLRWLEEANRFIQKFINENQLARWKKVLGR